MRSEKIFTIVFYLGLPIWFTAFFAYLGYCYIKYRKEVKYYKKLNPYDTYEDMWDIFLERKTWIFDGMEERYNKIIAKEKFDNKLLQFHKEMDTLSK